MSRLLVKVGGRDGFGDWVMLSAYLKMMNQQHPDVEIDISAHTVTDRYVRLPLVCGVRCRVNTPEEETSEYLKTVTWTLDGIYYEHPPCPPRHLIESLVICTNRQKVPQVRYDATALAHAETVKRVVVPVGPYIVMPSVGKYHRLRALHPNESRSFWEWNDRFKDKEWDGFNRLASRLSLSWPVVQIGEATDPPLDAAVLRYQELSFEELGYLYQNAYFAVALENGLSHWAGHQGTPCFTFYSSTYFSRPVCAYYPGQVALDGLHRKVTADEAYRVIMESRGEA